MFSIGAFSSACDVTRGLCRQLDIDVISADDAENLLTSTLQASNAQQAVIDRLGVRAANGGAWRRAGFQSEQVWFGHVTQQEPNLAGRRLRTARALLEAGGDVLSAYVDGHLSPTQANHIADGLVDAPPPPPSEPPASAETSEERATRERAEAQRRAREEQERRRREAELLEAARQRNLAKLQAEARRKAAADRDRMQGARQRRRFWTAPGDSGGVRGGFELPDETAALLNSLMERHFQPIFEAHKAEAAANGQRINWDHVRADTFASVLAAAASAGSAAGTNSVITYNVNVVIDEAGSVEWPDVWLMDGSISVPQEVADSLASDPVLRFLFSINGKLVGIGNDTAEIPKRVKKAVFARSGGYCENPNCSGKKGKEYHHQLPRLRGGLGSDPSNILLVCWYCHQLITYDGYLLIGSPDDLHWLVPGDDIPERYRQWMVDYEARATAPAKVFKPRSELPGEKRRRTAASDARSQRIRDARAKLDEDNVDVRGPTSSTISNGGDDDVGEDDVGEQRAMF